MSYLKKWGETNLNNISGRKGKVIFSKHQTRRQVEMELGSGFLHGIKVKLPRERKVDFLKLYFLKSSFH